MSNIEKLRIKAFPKSRKHGFKSGWEALVAKVLSKNKFQFRYESKRFHLNSWLRYTPDFILELQYDQKKIILEPHGIMRNGDIYKFSEFRRIYGSNYFLILLVRTDDIPFVSEDAYDDIWPIEYFPLFARQLKRKQLELQRARMHCGIRCGLPTLMDSDTQAEYSLGLRRKAIGH